MDEPATCAAPNDLPSNVLQALPAAVYTTDAAGRITFYNEAATALWGCRPQLGTSEFCGSWKLYHADGRPMPHDQCPMALALREKRPIRGVEAIAERPDGTRVPFIPFPTPLFDAAGEFVGAVNMLVDISERKGGEAFLARRMVEQAALYRFTDRLYRAESCQDVYEAALEAIVQALGCERASILMFDASGTMKFVAWRGLSENYRRAVEGHSPWSRGTKDPQPIAVADIRSAELPPSLKEVVATEGIGALAFIPLVAKGVLIGKFMTYYGAPHAFDDAEIDLAVTIARQLGFSLERMATDIENERLYQSARLLGSIVEASDDAIVSKDLTGIVTSWNQGAERLFGYTAAEAIGKPITIVIPPDRRAEEPDILKRIKQGERVDHFETVRMRKDGSLVDISLTVSPVKDSVGRIVGASKIARDITERKQLQARQDLLTREVHHRTKNLFAVVQAVVSRSFAGKKTVQEAEVTVINRLQSLAQTHAMLIEREWRGADIAEVIRAEMSPHAGRANIQGPPLMLSARAAQNFALALHELATNATKYGALSNATGHVDISWSVTKSESGGAFAFLWQERGGPPVEAPDRRGFGSVVLEQVMGEYMEESLRINFAVGGVTYELKGSLEAIATED